MGVTEEPVIHREEAVGIMFTITDMRKTLLRIEKLLGDDGEETEEEAE
jgi:hypothetical protein